MVQPFERYQVTNRQTNVSDTDRQTKIDRRWTLFNSFKTIGLKEVWYLKQKQKSDSIILIYLKEKMDKSLNQ